MARKHKIMDDPIRVTCSKRDFEDAQSLILQLKALTVGLDIAALELSEGPAWAMLRRTLGGIAEDLHTYLFGWQRDDTGL